jgi:predicted nucleic acid-binding protein
VDYLADTNVLLRALERNHPMHRPAWDALKTLRRRGDRICVTPQNIVEFWRGCTRPAERNGLGLSPEDTAGHMARIEKRLVMLPDVPEVHQEWKRLVVRYEVAGKQVHDARLVACMVVHNVRSILTFNTADFERYKFIQAVHPADVGAGKV